MTQQTQLSQYMWRVEFVHRNGLNNTYKLFSKSAGDVFLTISTNQRFNVGDKIRLFAVNTNEHGRLARKGIEIVWNTKKVSKGPVPAEIRKGYI